MNTIDILFIACLLLLYFLPKNSEKYKYYRIIPLVIFFVAIGIRIHSKVESHKNSETIKDLNSQINAQEINLNEKEQKIKVLEQKALKAEKGVFLKYNFRGDLKEGEGGYAILHRGMKLSVFNELNRLAKENKPLELIELATREIKETPDWLTPYLVRGAAYIDTRQFKKAVLDLKHVVAYADGDPDYNIPSQLLDALKREGYDSNQLLPTFRRLKVKPLL